MCSNSQFVATFSRCCFFWVFFLSEMLIASGPQQSADGFCYTKQKALRFSFLFFFFDHSVNPVSLHYSYLWHGCCWVQPLCCKLTGLITPAIHHQIHSLYTMGRRWDKNKLNNAVQLRQLLQTAEEYIVFMFRYSIYETVWGHVEAKRTLFRMNP